MQQPPNRQPGLSIFFPAYNDSGTIASLVIAARQTAASLTSDFEVIVVNDGSRDATAQIVDELALQLEAAYHAALAAGMSESEALGCAAAEVPDWSALAATLTQIERDAPGATASTTATATMGADAMNARRLIGGFGQDLRLAVRSLARTPGYAALAIGTLALGLGLGAAAFSLVDGVLIRPLPFPDADRLVLVKATVPPEGRETPACRPGWFPTCGARPRPSPGPSRCRRQTSQTPRSD